MKVLCIGSAVIDITAYPVGQDQIWKEKQRISGIQIQTGGDAANQCLHLAALGMEPALVACIGSDMNGEILKGVLDKAGVDTQMVKQKPASSTGMAMVLVDEQGERRIFSVQGAHSTISREEMPWEFPKECRAISLASLFSMPEFEKDGMLEYLKKAKQQGILVFADLAADKMAQGIEGIRKFLPYIDYFLPSLYDVLGMTQTESAMDAARALRGLGVPHIVIKCGKDGCYCLDEGFEGWIPAIPVRTVDTTGAGDCMVAVFISRILQGDDIEAACRCACEAASYSTLSLGTAPRITGQFSVIRDIRQGKELVWINPDKAEYGNGVQNSNLTMADIEDAEQRLSRFAPYIMKCFPKTRKRKGLIESDLVPILAMRELINIKYGSRITGTLLLKKDSHLAIAGSVKARGGIYEVLKHTEELALEHGLLREGDSYDKLAEKEAREFFGRYTIQVGSTGNLGLSIGIMSAAIGYKAIVHMSADAKQWKKDLLRSHGVTVLEYESDYSEAVKNGRTLSAKDPMSYFVDDENSRSLFLGYAVAAKRLVGQLHELGITVDMEHPLFVYLPCGVGGAPGGISFGLKQVFKDSVHCFFVEPVQAPCMLLGMATGLNGDISVQDIGLTGQTQADGLAVGRPSGFVGSVMKHMQSGEFTVRDERLYDYMRELLDTEKIFLEPSACAAFQGPVFLNKAEEARKYLEENNLIDKMGQATHIVWATGGSLVPKEVRETYQNTYFV